jgi:hypothetical protein
MKMKFEDYASLYVVLHAWVSESQTIAIVPIINCVPFVFVKTESYCLHDKNN